MPRSTCSNYEPGLNCSYPFLNLLARALACSLRAEGGGFFFVLGTVDAVAVFLGGFFFRCSSSSDVADGRQAIHAASAVPSQSEKRDNTERPWSRESSSS
ncbi:unnamed protein product [Periconia digitata]|uniref:Uncharacterized protein n=1 Tax=Periconia digitata TaxID=1303443 RepID=A0A9W4XDK8_9PLEO|nr:unnamed protein product [Periconia digitata]